MKIECYLGKSIHNTLNKHTPVLAKQMYIVWILKTFSFHSIIIIIFPYFSTLFFFSSSILCCYCCGLFTVAIDSSIFPRTCTCTKHYRVYITLSNRLSAFADVCELFLFLFMFHRSLSLSLSPRLDRASNRAFKIMYVGFYDRLFTLLFENNFSIFVMLYFSQFRWLFARFLFIFASLLFFPCIFFSRFIFIPIQFRSIPLNFSSKWQLG